MKETGRRISRRDFLKLAGLGLGSILLTQSNSQIDPLLKIFIKEDSVFSFDEFADLAIRFDRVYDKLPRVSLDMTPGGLIKYAQEIAPQFAYEAISPPVDVPDELIFVHYENSTRANHVLGRSDCKESVEINQRSASAISSWYQRDDFLFTLTHELAHTAQGEQLCEESDQELLEASADIAAMEVVSGLALQGNPAFFRAVVGEIRHMATSSALAIAMKDKDMEKFNSFRRKLSQNPVNIARFEKGLRFWEDDRSTFNSILEAYSLKPLTMVLNAIKNNNDIVEIAMRPIYFRQGQWNAYYHYPDGYPVKLDDTHYLIEHMEELAYGFAHPEN